jgi:NADH:ubiquinone oxidoreductase subunit 5 (subunit L)/multisubunit Na+/H+ antiporter MnhA subunit
MSQLGYMIIAIGLSQYYISIKHLIMHAFFKSLLFLCAGAIIHAINDQQDIRKKGNIRNIMPFTYLGFILGSLSLIAFPFSAGFYSKDLLIEILRTQSINYTYIYGYIITLISAFITMLYILRILNLVFINKPNYNNKNLILQIKETPLCTIPIIILSILSIIIGYYMQNINNIAFNELFINKNNEYSTINIYNSIYTFKPILICILFIILIYMKYNINLENKNVCDQFYKLNKFNVLSNRITCAYFINSNKINKLIDRGLFNYFGVIGFNKYILYLANY